MIVKLACHSFLGAKELIDLLSAIYEGPTFDEEREP